ncbi:MAG: HisA/HisF-related TIM barrel protein [Phycisphaerae bacterium]
MEILPAIDLRGGKVVRLQRGDYGRSTQYSDDPAAVAGKLVAAGARWIHVVDLDAALTGKPTNLREVPSILMGGLVAGLEHAAKLHPAVNEMLNAGASVAFSGSTPLVMPPGGKPDDRPVFPGNRTFTDFVRGIAPKVELGGGARDAETIRFMLEAIGASRVVVGSAALKDWAWFERLVATPALAGRIALGLDARDGMLAVHGWTEQSRTPAVEVARRTRGWPLGAIVYTDIGRDGMLAGVNVKGTAGIVEATDVPVIASGGVSGVEDIVACRRIGCAGAIIGKAWYEGRIDLAEALSAARD